MAAREAPPDRLNRALAPFPPGAVMQPAWERLSNFK